MEIVSNILPLLSPLHANNALALLEQPSKQEKQLLGAFRYIDNKAFLHFDETLMPKRKEHGQGIFRQ